MNNQLKIFGQMPTMVQPGERRYTVRFGSIEAGYACIPNVDGTEHGPFPWWVRFMKHECERSHVLGSESTAALAIAAIERELCDLRNAIPEDLVDDRPKIFGVPMAPLGDLNFQWKTKFYTLNVYLDTTDGPSLCRYSVGGTLIRSGTKSECIEAIEHELRAIKAAIP